MFSQSRTCACAEWSRHAIVALEVRYVRVTVGTLIVAAVIVLPSVGYAV